jgi:chemotaxis methyl-accepting protein methylase
VFAPHNLIRDAPFTKMDLISCRNLLIYFQPHAQKTVLTLFHFSLKPGGLLFLGSSEALEGWPMSSTAWTITRSCSGSAATSGCRET